MKTHFYRLKVLLSLSLIFTSTYILNAQPAGEYLNWAGGYQFGPSGSIHLDKDRNLAFLGSGGAVRILDISTPSDPVLVNEDIRTQGLVEDIWYNKDDENLYLACGRGGLEIWDVNDYNNPVRLSHVPIYYFEVETPVRHIELYNNIAVLECSWGYLQTVDISDPQNPEQLYFNGEMGNPAHDFHIDKFGFVHATGAHYYIKYKLNGDGSLTNYGIHSFIYGSYAVFGREEEAFVQYGGDMYILDLTIPGFLAWSITPVAFSDIIVIDDLAYLVNEEGFEIWDVSNLQAPFLVSAVDIPYANELYIAGNLVYISSGNNGFSIVDISDINNPQMSGSYPGNGWSAATAVSGNYAYVAHSSDGLYIIDINDPYENGPELTAVVPSYGETRDVEVQGQIAYVADWTGGFRIIDVSDPSNPLELSTVDIQAWRISTGPNNIVYVNETKANAADTLKIFDVSDPEYPIMTGTYVYPETAYETKYSDGYLYVADFNSGLKIIDVSDPYNPFQAAVVDYPWVFDVSIQNEIAYVASADWDGGFITIDISDPADPQVLQVYNPEGWFHPFHVTVSGIYAYVSLNFGEIHLFDVSDPSNVQEMDTYVTPGESIHLLAHQNFLIVSDGPTGLQIIENNLITGIEDFDVSSNKAIDVFPNPVNDEVNIRYSSSEISQLQVSFMSIDGKLLYSANTGIFTGGEQHIKFRADDIFGNTTGTVIYEIKAGNEVYHGKLIRIRQ